MSEKKRSNNTRENVAKTETNVKEVGRNCLVVPSKLPFQLDSAKIAFHYSRHENSETIIYNRGSR